MTDQIDVAYVDSKFQRSGRDQRTNLTISQSALCRESQLARKAAVMCGNVLLAKTVSEIVRETLGESTSVDENQRGAMLLDKLIQAVINLIPDHRGRDGSQLALWNFDREVHLAAMSYVHNCSGCAAWI